MMLKIIGAFCIVAACGSVGYYLVLNHKKEEAALQQLIAVLDFMGCELQYRMTPLPELCRLAAAENRGIISNVMLQLANELDSQISPDASACMTATLAGFRLPDRTNKLLLQLGGSLGRFDLNGQLRGLENIRQLCRKELEEMSRDRGPRLRSYQTLALCAGAALAILFL